MGARRKNGNIFVCVCVCVRNESEKKERKCVCVCRCVFRRLRVGVYFGGSVPVRLLNMEKTFSKQSSKFFDVCVRVRNESAKKKENMFVCVFRRLRACAMAEHGEDVQQTVK